MFEKKTKHFNTMDQYFDETTITIYSIAWRGTLLSIGGSALIMVVPLAMLLTDAPVKKQSNVVAAVDNVLSTMVFASPLIFAGAGVYGFLTGSPMGFLAGSVWLFGSYLALGMIR